MVLVQVETEHLQDVKKSCLERLKMKQESLDKISIFLAELIGTALFVFIGCMGCIQSSDTLHYENNHLQTVLNFGLAVMVIIQCFGCVSGAHLNPAVTLAAFIYGLLSLPMALVYFIAQMFGAFIGYGLLKTLVPGVAIRTAGSEGLCVTIPTGTISDFQAVVIEFIITGILILICCSVWDPRNAKLQDSVALRFGLAVTCLACSAGHFTGASMNPARSFAPALWNSNFKQHWVYWVGPLGGSAVFSLIFKSVFRREVVEQPINNKLRAMEEVPLS